MVILIVSRIIVFINRSLGTWRLILASGLVKPSESGVTPSAYRKRGLRKRPIFIGLTLVESSAERETSACSIS